MSADSSRFGHKQSLTGHSLTEVLYIASAKGYLPIVQKLFKDGASVGLRDMNGQPVLYYMTRNFTSVWQSSYSYRPSN
ncbi:hypothetical protein HZ326_10676 [Fusarium oxysporum f. sp. albedinis]|nr:hypothetical protein HZ326_10676 [Fusarium oxysporum f. sp. albedinis]